MPYLSVTINSCLVILATPFVSVHEFVDCVLVIIPLFFVLEKPLLASFLKEMLFVNTYFAFAVVYMLNK